MILASLHIIRKHSCPDERQQEKKSANKSHIETSYAGSIATGSQAVKSIGDKDGSLFKKDSKDLKDSKDRKDQRGLFLALGVLEVPWCPS